MGLRINTNVPSLNARRNLGAATNRLNRNFERLSTGQRINSARDDAAGLAISSKLSSRIRVMGTAIRNANDATSLLQTSEGALEETTNLVQRIRELAVQAASDTNTFENRDNLQSEVDQLVEEVDRVAKSTTFNGRSLIDGSLNGSEFHVGPNARESISVRISDMRSRALGRQVRVTGEEIDPNTPIDQAQLYLNGLKIRHTVEADDEFSTALPEGSAIAKANAINSISEFTGVRALANETVVFGEQPEGGTLDDFNNVIINGYLFAGFKVEQTDATGQLVNAINAEYAETGVLASIDDELGIRLTAEDGRNIEVFTSTAASARITGLNQDAPDTVVTGGSITLVSENLMEVTLDDAGIDDAIGFGSGLETILFGPNDENALDTIDLTTREGANTAIEIADVALRQVNEARAGLGALYNRLQSTIDNLGVGRENLSDAHSRIVDTDFATETADFARNSILQQAGISVLAQANTSPTMALNLLSVGGAGNAA